MPTPKKGPRLGGSPAHQKLMVSNLATALCEHGRITTTEARARVLRPVAEKLITKAKKAELGTVESLHHRREVLKTIRDKSVVHTLFTEIGPRFAERPGGYTRITKIGPRKVDNAPMAVIELVNEKYDPKPAAKKTPAKKAAAPAPVAEDEAPAEDTAVADVPTELTDEASPETSVIAEEQPGADDVEPAEGTDDVAEAEAAAPAEDAAEDAPAEDSNKA